MTLARSHRNSFLEADQELPMLEGALTCLTHLLTFQLLSGMPERELVKKEMVNLVCVLDRTHSQLLEYVPERSSAPWSQVSNSQVSFMVYCQILLVSIFLHEFLPNPVIEYGGNSERSGRV